MSSNCYGFENSITWNDRNYFIVVVLAWTGYDSEEMLSRADEKLEKANINPRDPIELARRELQDRDWTKAFDSRYISVWGCYPTWKDDDPSDPTWNPPQPTEKEILKIIAMGGLEEEVFWQWDT